MARRPPPAVATTDIAVDAPPGPPPRPPSLLPRLVPVVAVIATLAAMAASFWSGSAVTRNPMFVAFPIMMLVSTAVTVASGRGQRRGGGIDVDRVDYLGYLSGLRRTVTETAAAQRFSLLWNHPDPDTLWTLIGGPRMWERQASDPDFCLVRVGVGTQPLATRLVAAEAESGPRSDPVTAVALRRFVDTHSTVAEVPVTVGLRAVGTVTVDGDADAARGLLRALVCQLAVLHPPDQLLIAAAVSDRRQAHWDWLKWLPHNQDPTAVDAVGSARMVYRSMAEARDALAGTVAAHRVIVADLDEHSDPGAAGAIKDTTVLRVGAGGEGTALTLQVAGEVQPVPRPDRMDALDALVCARRLARYRAGGASAVDDGGWLDLAGPADVADDDRLCVPIGTTIDGMRLVLDIKEPAENGMGPHGLCLGATGSGKSELLRTIALGMMARNSPESLNLLLIDFKGGATFLDLARAPHVAAIITNLADEAPLVARMHDALAGEMNRRQQLLRTARCASIAAFQRARRAGGGLPPLPTLFVIVDEFSELLSQHPDFADVFVAIGRLGRSLGVHLLLASQRLDEGRLRGLEAHLSYRICLKTLSAGESRAALGTPDAYHLPNTPGAGFLRCSNGEPIRFQAASVSTPLEAHAPSCAPPVTELSVRPFSARAVGPLTRAAEPFASPTRTVLQAVLDRLVGQGPPAHQVWLPPLGAAPALATLLRDGASASADLAVPIGVVDRPFDQCRTPLMVDLSGAAGNVAVVGAPQSGKSTALRTLITALAATHDARRVQFYCLDLGGGALASVRSLPHVGAVAGRAEPELVRRVVAEMESIVRYREARRPIEPFADVFLVVDGWAGLRHEFEALEAPVTALAAQGLSFGVHVMLSASRWAEIRPSLRDQIGTRIELRLGDPADSEIDRKRAHQVPHGRPGRGLSQEGLQMVIARPIDEIPRGETVAPPIPLLPARVDLETVVHRAGVDMQARILLGLDERRMGPVPVDFERHSHLLVLGDNQCGKTATLRALCREIARSRAAAEAQLWVIDFRRALLGVVESEHLGGYAMSAAALGALLASLLDVLQRRMPPSDVTQAQLLARSWWSGPDIYLVVDDYDLVATPSGNPLAPIAEYLPFARDLGLHLIVARRSGGAERALFEPLLAGLRDLGCLTLMMSRHPDEGPLFGSGRPARLPPGRGVLIARGGDEQLIQVAWTTPP
ncbi:type VII secretion protein EccC [Mycobacterium sp. 852002-51057_SCH5723018]|nr:type VII secretion protein EccC [Mycobacterium sp. 852002-51057_SCH5723018]